MKTRIMSLMLVLLSIPIFAQIQSIQITDNASHLNITINGNTRSIPKRDLNLQYVDPNITLSMNGTRIFKIDNHALVTVPTSTNIVDLNEKLILLLKESAGITIETDPVFSSSPAAGITAPNITNWNSAYGLVGNTVNLAGDQTITDNKTFTGVITSNGIIPSANGSFNLGSTTSRFLGVYASNFLNPGTTILGSTVSIGPINFRQGSSSQFVGGFQPTTGNAFDQAPGVVPTDNGFRRSIYGNLYVEGSSSLAGQVTSQDIVPDGNVTRSIGNTSSRYTSVWSGIFINNGTSVFGTNSTSSPIQFRQGSSTSLSGGFFSTTGNFYIQPMGVTPADNGYRASIYGTLLATGKADFTGPYTGGQITVGSTGEAGNIVMNNGSNGTGIFTIGYAAANSTTPTIQSTGANGLNITATGSGVIVQGTGSGGLVRLRTGNADRVSISSVGQINFQNVPTYADNAAATSGGLVVGDVYRTSTGQLMIRF